LKKAILKQIIPEVNVDELFDLFRKVLEKESDDIKKESIKQKFLGMRIPSLSLNKVELRPSIIHGKVFS
jgi:hypothetical protein